MEDFNLTQKEADDLIKMRKIFETKKRSYKLPSGGDKETIPLVNDDKSIIFSLDMTSSSISLTKYSHQNRVYKNVVLVRLDVNGSTHRNPDDALVSRDHLHIYKEGFDDKFAYELSEDFLAIKDKPFELLQKFLEYCDIEQFQRITQSKELFL